MAAYAAQRRVEGVPLRGIVRHMLGLYHGRPGARAWRRTLSDSRLLADADERLLYAALDAVEAAGTAASGDRAAGATRVG
jgi:tRNA-dihydrouridine synthase A